MDVRSQYRGRDTTPDRAKMCRQQQQKIKPPKRVQVVYYLSRNGLLEHPHFVEITLFPNEPLRLKDVFDRLVALRGSGMPSQYSWSCKRNYKSGYVWCDLALNDIIHPAEGAEYVLKGSELVEGCSGRFQQLHVSNNKQAIHQAGGEPNYNNSNNGYNPKRKSFNCSPHNTQREAEEYEEYEEDQDEEYEEGVEERTSYTSSTTTPHSRCSRGVSTDELLDEYQEPRPNKPQLQKSTHHKINNATSKVVVIADDNKEGKRYSREPQPQLPTTCNSTSTLAEKLNQDGRNVNSNSNSNKCSKRFEEEEETESAPSRNSVLLQLIACGSSGADFKAKAEPRRVSNVGAKSACVEMRRAENYVGCGGSEAEMINYVSENPRFGNLQAEEKEYFSGSLVESIKANRSGSEVEPVLKRSNSYNEERGSRLGIEEVKLAGTEEEKREAKGGVKGKCIPRKKSSKESKK